MGKFIDWIMTLLGVRGIAEPSNGAGAGGAEYKSTTGPEGQPVAGVESLLARPKQPGNTEH